MIAECAVRGSRGHSLKTNAGGSEKTIFYCSGVRSLRTWCLLAVYTAVYISEYSLGEA